MRKIALLAGVLLFLSAGRGMADGDRYVEQVTLRSGQVVVVTEGDFEPRSIGSYAVRLYSGAVAGFPVDDFVAGIITEREGYLEKVVSRDLDGDSRDELVVLIRSAGTGNYLSAHAFSIGTDSLAFLAAAENLAPDADPIASLIKSITKSKP